MHVCSVYRYSIKYCKVSGKISVLPHTIVKQSRSLKSNLLIPPLFSLSKNCMCHEIWDCAEILPVNFLLLSKIRFPLGVWSKAVGVLHASGGSLKSSWLGTFTLGYLWLVNFIWNIWWFLVLCLCSQNKKKRNSKSEKDNSTAIRFGWCSFTTAIISVFLFL